jgi:ankyrin repeat protein
MQDKTNEILIETNTNYSSLLIELGIKWYLLQDKKGNNYYDKNLDFALLYQRLRIAMSENYLNIGLQCTSDWQIQILGGQGFDEKTLKNWTAFSDNAPEVIKSKKQPSWWAQNYAEISGKPLINDFVAPTKMPKKSQQVDNWGARPVHYLAWTGNLNFIKWIVKNSPKALEQKDKFNRTPIHFLGWSGNLDALDLIKATCPKELTKEDSLGATPIHYLAWSHNPKALSWIKGNNAKDLKKKDSYGRTPIHYFAWSDKTDVSQQMQAISPKDFKVKDNIGKSTIHFASITGNCEKLQFIYVNYPKALHKTDKYGRTPIHFAAKSGNPEVFDWVTDNCADTLKGKSKNGAIPSNYAALSGNPHALNQALALSQSPETWALCNAFSRDESIHITKTLMKALKTNYTLTAIEFNDFSIGEKAKALITQNLSRNLSIKHTIVRFIAFLQGLKQLENPVSNLLDDKFSLGVVFKYLLSEDARSSRIITEIQSKTKFPIETYSSNSLTNRFFTEESLSTQTSVNSSQMMSFGDI